MSEQDNRPSVQGQQNVCGIDIKTNGLSLSVGSDGRQPARSGLVASHAYRADGGQEVLPVAFQAYEHEAILEIDDSGDEPRILNHDELEADGFVYLEVRGMRADVVDDWDLEVVDEDDPLWSPELATIGEGESYRVDELQGGSA